MLCPSVLLGGDMDDTRRQLFRTSILSALGLAGVAGLVSCDRREEQYARQAGERFTADDPSIPIVGKATSDGLWYILRLHTMDEDAQTYTYKAWQVQAPESPPAGTPATAVDGDYIPFDVDAWFRHLNKKKKLNLATSPFTLGGIPCNPDQKGIVSGDAAKKLHNGTKAVTAIWNEIGKT